MIVEDLDSPLNLQEDLWWSREVSYVIHTVTTRSYPLDRVCLVVSTWSYLLVGRLTRAPNVSTSRLSGVDMIQCIRLTSSLLGDQGHLYSAHQPTVEMQAFY